MSIWQALVLGVVQGLSEFLPISSSAHLYVVPTLLGWRYAGVAFDVALHWGTLLALLAAYGRDWLALAADAVARDPERRRAAWIVWLKLAAAMLVLFGFLLWAVDRFRPPGREVAIPGWGACLVVGCAQALALVPGVSRSGV